MKKKFTVEVGDWQTYDAEKRGSSQLKRCLADPSTMKAPPVWRPSWAVGASCCPHDRFSLMA